MADDPTSPAFLWGLFVCQLCETSTVLFLYGLYVNLFILGFYTLYHRRTSGRTWLLAASGMLFVFGTLQTLLRILNLTMLVHAMALLVNSGPGEAPMAQIIGLLQNRLQLELVGNAVFAVNVRYPQLYRCYLIWGSQVKPILLPGILILATTSGGVEVITAATAYTLGLATNLVLMGLTTGRIWSMRRTLAKLDVPGLHNSIDTRFNAAISIIPLVKLNCRSFESGFIYCFSGLSLVIALATGGWNTVVYPVLLGAAYQAINIAPTLTIVRVGLGHNIEDAVKSQQT
ncbi:hypothetical protein C8R46DRAFT_1303091 [Mycena filopes]|nr:hypothetical protein C8R46DRAFT_1303091 [Mycena filopes]